MDDLLKNKLKDDLKDLQEILTHDKVSIVQLNFTLGRISLLRELITDN
ncbi:hypothetical protein [Clostridium sp. BJN0013]